MHCHIRRISILHRIDFNFFLNAHNSLYFGPIDEKNLCNFIDNQDSRHVLQPKAKIGVPGIRAFHQGYLDFEYLLLVVFLIYQRPNPSRTNCLVASL
jgi:hypothetical protein